MNREWISNSNDGLYMSILFNSDLPTTNIPLLSLLTGLSVCETLNEFVDNKDIILNNNCKKIGKEEKW